MRNFLDKGPLLDLITDETLAAKGDEMDVPTIAAVMEDAESKAAANRKGGPGVEVDDDGWKGFGPPPDADAKAGLPIAWSVSSALSDNA